MKDGEKGRWTGFVDVFIEQEKRDMTLQKSPSTTIGAGCLICICLAFGGALPAFAVHGTHFPLMKAAENASESHILLVGGRDAVAYGIEQDGERISLHLSVTIADARQELLSLSTTAARVGTHQDAMFRLLSNAGSDSMAPVFGLMRRSISVAIDRRRRLAYLEPVVDVLETLENKWDSASVDDQLVLTTMFILEMHRSWYAREYTEEQGERFLFIPVGIDNPELKNLIRIFDSESRILRSLFDDQSHGASFVHSQGVLKFLRNPSVLRQATDRLARETKWRWIDRGSLLLVFGLTVLLVLRRVRSSRRVSGPLPHC